LSPTDHFLVYNGDLIHSIDLEDLLRRHEASGRIGTLAGIFHPIHNTLRCDGEGTLVGVQGFDNFDGGPAGVAGEGLSALTFAGIAVYRREFLDFARRGPQDIKRYWMDALKAGESLGVVDCGRAAWHDFGTPQGLWEAAKFMMESTGEFSFRYASMMGENRPYVANEADQDDLPEALSNVLVMEESAVPILPNTANCIIGRDFQWRIQP